jgi:hypothetical protein
MQALKITQCSDPMMWYRDLVGKIVPLHRCHTDCFMSREPAGYANIVKLTDAVIIEVDEQKVPVPPYSI